MKYEFIVLYHTDERDYMKGCDDRTEHQAIKTSHAGTELAARRQVMDVFFKRGWQVKKIKLSTKGQKA